MNDKQLKIIISAIDNASGTIRDIARETKVSTTQMASAVALGQMAWDGLKYAVRETYVALKDTIKSASENEFAEVKMTQALRNSGTVTEEQIVKLKKYAEAVQYKVGVSDEEIKQSIAMLGTFKLQGSTIEKTIPALLDLASAYRQSTGEAMNLSEWAIKLGKAEAIPELATQLRRVGIVFTDVQIEAMRMATEEERVLMITEELSKEFGGQALKQAETFGGKMQILGVYVDEFKEKIGGAIIKGLNPFIEKLMGWLGTENAGAFFDKIAEGVDKMVTQMSIWVKDVAIPFIQEQMPAMIEQLKQAQSNWHDWTQGIRDSIVPITNFAGKIEPFTKALVSLNSVWMFGNIEMKGVRESLLNLFDTTKKYLPVVENNYFSQLGLQKAFDVTKEKQKELTDSTKRLYEAETILNERQSELTAMQSNLSLVTQTYGEDSDQARTARENLKQKEQEIELALGTVRDRQQEVNDKTNAVSDASNKAKDSVSAYKDEIIRLADGLSAILNNSPLVADALERVIPSLKDYTSELLIANNQPQTFRGDPSYLRKQYGGEVIANQPYMVGEAGTEVFVPNRSGRIVPNNQIQSGGSSVNITIQAGVINATEGELRRFAEMLGMKFKELAQSKGTTINNYLGNI